MAFNSISTLQKNRQYAPIILGLTIFVAIFATRPAFSSYNDAKMLLSATETEISMVQSELNTLRANATKIADPDSELSKKVAKVARDFNPSEIIEAIMINRFTTKNALSAQNFSVVVKDIKIDKGVKEPSGLYRGTVNMTISAANVPAIASFLDYLTGLENFAFSLNDISLPLEIPANAPGTNELSVSVKLGLYYYP